MKAVQVHAKSSQARTRTQKARSAHDEPAIVVYQSADSEGSTFGLSLRSRRLLEQEFGGAVKLTPRVFVAHQTRDDYWRLHSDLKEQIVILLTGLSLERLERLGRVEFRDPVTEQPVTSQPQPR